MDLTDKETKSLKIPLTVRLISENTTRVDGAENQTQCSNITADYKSSEGFLEIAQCKGSPFRDMDN